MAKRFMRAYRKARAWLLATPADRVAEAEASFFPEIDRAVLITTIGTYQKLGCWTPRVEITQRASTCTSYVGTSAAIGPLTSFPVRTSNCAK